MGKISVHVNDFVKVKLTDYGITILKDRHDQLNEMLRERGAIGLPFEFKIDEEGYFETELWSLMNVFGTYMALDREEPFDLNIMFSIGRENVRNKGLEKVSRCLYCKTKIQSGKKYCSRKHASYGNGLDHRSKKRAKL